MLFLLSCVILRHSSSSNYCPDDIYGNVIAKATWRDMHAGNETECTTYVPLYGFDINVCLHTQSSGCYGCQIDANSAQQLARRIYCI